MLKLMERQMRELQIAAGQPLGSVIQYTIRVLATLALALYLSWKVTLVTIAVVPVSALFISFLSSRMKPVVRAQQSELSGASKLTHDAFSAIEVVKCLNGQTSTYCQFVSYIRAAAKWYMKLAFLTAIQMAWTRFASFAMFVQGFWYGSTLVQSEELTPGQVLSTFWACLIAVQSIEMGINYLPALERGKLAGATLNSYLQGSRPKVSSPGRTRNCCPDPSKGDVVLKDVSRRSALLIATGS
jgi:ATP-binding cassette subfamily B (MDR/TAP) protein 1